MFPGYVTIYKDERDFIHLYFFPGVTDEGLPFYKDLDLLDCKLENNRINHTDGAIEYIFTNKRIIRFNCTLVENKTGKQHKTILSLNNARR